MNQQIYFSHNILQTLGELGDSCTHANQSEYQFIDMTLSHNALMVTVGDNEHTIQQYFNIEYTHNETLTFSIRAKEFCNFIRKSCLKGDAYKNIKNEYEAHLLFDNNQPIKLRFSSNDLKHSTTENLTLDTVRSEHTHKPEPIKTLPKTNRVNATHIKHLILELQLLPANCNNAFVNIKDQQAIVTYEDEKEIKQVTIDTLIPTSLKFAINSSTLKQLDMATKSCSGVVAILARTGRLIIETEQSYFNTKTPADAEYLEEQYTRNDQTIAQLVLSDPKLPMHFTDHILKHSVMAYLHSTTLYSLIEAEEQQSEFNALDVQWPNDLVIRFDLKAFKNNMCKLTKLQKYHQVIIQVVKNSDKMTVNFCSELNAQATANQECWSSTRTYLTEQFSLQNIHEKTTKKSGHQEDLVNF